MKFWIAPVVLVIVLASAAAAWAEVPADPGASSRARTLYEEGVKRYNLANFQAALNNFQEAYLARPDPVLLFNVGQCHRQMGNLKEEVYAYRRYLSEMPDAPNRAEVEHFIADAETEMQRRRAEAPPTGPLAPSPKEAKPAVSEPIVVSPAAVAAPKPIVVSPAAVAAPAAERTPIYRRWWLWTGIAVVAVAVGVGIGFAASGTTWPEHSGDTAGSALVRF